MSMIWIKYGQSLADSRDDQFLAAGANVIVVGSGIFRGNFAGNVEVGA